VTIEEIEAIARRVPQPKLIKMLQGGKTPLVPVARLETLGYQIVIIPSDLQRATARAPRSPTAWHRSPSASKSSTAPAGSRGTRSTAAET